MFVKDNAGRRSMALTVALLGIGSPIGILFAALLFSTLKIGGTSILSSAGRDCRYCDSIDHLLRRRRLYHPTID